MDRAQLIAAIQNHQQALFAIAFQYCGNRQDAEDVVQDVFLKLFKADEAFHSEEHLRYWLVRVTINRCKDLLRNPFRRLRAGFEEAEAVLSAPQEHDTEVFDAVMALPLKYREVVMLYYFQGYSAPQIGMLLHRKSSTVQTQLMRARGLLKEKLKEVWNDDTP
ncbi:MAG: sigma-70 family RNA polymerase sigma factor [Oscillospiraceae bacterium]|nr:sigma-70 family RNA polymerase sigma factor [Oscillospiraceae bacterium]